MCSEGSGAYGYTRDEYTNTRDEYTNTRHEYTNARDEYTNARDEYTLGERISACHRYIIRMNVPMYIHVTTRAHKRIRAEAAISDVF